MTFGEKIKNVRIENNLTQQELANKLFVSRSAVAKWEQDRGMPSLELMEKLSETLGLPVSELMSDKEMRSIMLDSSQKLDNQKRYNKIIIAVVALLIASIIALFVGLFTKRGESVHDLAYYGQTVIEDEKIGVKISSDNWYDNNLTVYLKGNEQVYDKYSRKSSCADIRSGYRVRIEIKSPYEYVPNDEKKELVTVSRVDIIDDYVEGDYTITGFFVATEEYNGDVAPVNVPSYGYEYEEFGYTEYDITYSISYRFPCAFWSYNGHYCSVIDMPSMGETEYGKFTNYKLKFKYYYSLAVSRNVQTVYVYVLDNSAKGFSLYQKLTSENRFSTINGALFNNNYKDNIKGAYKADMFASLAVTFEQNFSAVKIFEYDKNNVEIAKTELTFYEQACAKSFIMSQDQTRYIIVRQGYVGAGRYAIGQYVYLSMETKYGYLLKTSFRVF